MKINPLLFIIIVYLFGYLFLFFILTTVKWKVEFEQSYFYKKYNKEFVKKKVIYNFSLLSWFGILILISVLFVVEIINFFEQIKPWE